MRIKTLGMLTVSGLFAAAFAYSVPALADDTTTGTGTDTQATQPADNAQSNTGAMNDNTGAATDSSSSSTSGSSTDSSSGSSNDGTADMPSGDDDY